MPAPPLTRIANDRSPHDLLHALALTPEYSHKDGFNFGLREASQGPMPEIDGSTIGGKCSLWCVPHNQPECMGGLGQRQRQGYPIEYRDDPVCSPSIGSDAGSDGDMFESTRLGLALDQLMMNMPEGCDTLSSIREADIKENEGLEMMDAAEELNSPFSPSLWRPIPERPVSATAIPSNCLSIGSRDTCDTGRDTEASRLIWSQSLSPSATLKEQDSKVAVSTSDSASLDRGQATLLENVFSHALPPSSLNFVPRAAGFSSYSSASADDVSLHLLGVNARRRLLVAGDGPDMRPPHAVALCGLQDLPTLSMALPNGQETNEGDPADAANAKAPHSSRQRELEAVLRQMPIPDLSQVQQDCRPSNTPRA
jgi:hypothetical protein